MKIALSTKSLLRPSIVSMVAMFLSFACWLFPSFGVLDKGFNNPSRLDLTSFVILACWYLLIFISFTVGQKAGELVPIRKGASRSRLLDLETNSIYYGFTLLSFVGIAAELTSIFRTLSLKEVIVFIGLGQANELKEALYGDYSVGLVSLRYAVLFSASIALLRIIRFKRITFVNVFNVLLLCVSALVSSRLIFVATILTTLFTASYGEKSIKLSIPKLIVSAAILFLVLSALNSSRNARYYESNHLSFGLAGVTEILRYLGSPFQAAIASAKVTDQLVAGGTDTYRNYVDEEKSLNTNSAFVGLHQQMGYFCWAYIAVLCLLMGFVFAFLASLGRTIFLLPCGAILYGSAELWRVDLFQAGIFIVWFVIGIGLPVFVIGSQRLLVFIGNLPRKSAVSLGC